MNPITLDELDSIGETVTLTSDAAHELAETGLVEVHPLDAGRFQVVPRSGVVGAVRVGDLQVEIKPKDKLRLSHLLFLLSYAKDPGFDPGLDWIQGSKDDELWPALGYSLTRLVERALRQGVLQGYQTLDEPLRTIRGRIRFGEQLSRHSGLMVPIEVTFDEFSIDIAENQILLAALTRMLAVPRLDDDLRRRLFHLSARLEGVTRLRPGFSMPVWHPSRLNERYHSALRLASIVLEHSSIKPSAAGVDVAAFVVTMWKVFEDFVTVALQEAMQGRPGQVVSQLESWLTGEGQWEQGGSGEIRMAVDLVHLEPPKVPRAIFDAKYKFASPTGRYANADHYQMLAYCTALKVKTAWLVYAAGAGSASRRRVKNSEVTIVESPLDLETSPREILEQIQAIADDAAQTLVDS